MIREVSYRLKIFFRFKSVKFKWSKGEKFKLSARVFSNDILLLGIVLNCLGRALKGYAWPSRMGNRRTLCTRSWEGVQEVYFGSVKGGRVHHLRREFLKREDGGKLPKLLGCEDSMGWDW